jgi:hypothetical protein
MLLDETEKCVATTFNMAVSRKMAMATVKILI